MTHTRFLSERFDPAIASVWIADCAALSGWTEDEAERLGSCVAESAQAVSERAYCLRETGPVFLKLDFDSENATIEMHHEGALGDRPCDCAAAQRASKRVSTNWTDAQLRTHRLTIARN